MLIHHSHRIQFCRNSTVTFDTLSSFLRRLFTTAFRYPAQRAKTGWGCKQTGKDDSPFKTSSLFWISNQKRIHPFSLSNTHTHLSRCRALPQQACRVIPTHSSTSAPSSRKLGCRRATTDSGQDARCVTDRLAVTWRLKRSCAVYRGNVTLTDSYCVDQLCVGVCDALVQRCGSTCYWQNFIWHVPSPITVTCTEAEFTYTVTTQTVYPA